jgi:hypothetical protein
MEVFAPKKLSCHAIAIKEEKIKSPIHLFISAIKLCVGFLRS